MNPNEKYQPLIDDKIKKTTTQIIQAPYDPYKVPPNFDEAEAHYYATRIAKPIELPGGNHVHDKASGLQIENQPLGLCSDKEELNFLSPGYPMYFQWVRFTMFIGFVIIVFSGIFNLQSFYAGSNCLSEETFVAQTTNQTQSNTTVSSFVLQRFLQSENMTDEQLAEVTETCPRNMVNRFSLANRIGDDAALEKTDIYNFFTIIILLLCMQFIRKIQKQTAILCDERAITASDFTAKVTNIPKDFTEKEDIDEEIRKFFTTNGIPGKTVQVKNVSVCYNCDAIVQEDTKLKEAVQLRATLLAKKSKKQLVSDDEIRKVEASIETCKKNIASISKKFEEGVGVSKQFEGEAYVTFETQQELQAVVQNWHLGRLARIRESLIANSKYKFRKNILTVREAPEPSDVYWENAGTPHITRLTLRVITNIVTIIVLFAGFYTVFTINSAKVNLLSTLSQKNESAEEKSFVLTVAVKSISIVASCVVVVVNMILRIVIMALTKREKFSTYTELQSTYAIRLALCQFCNTALITFAVAVYFRNITGPGGLTYTAFFIFLTNVVVQCGMTLFSPATIMYYLKKRGIEKNKADCLLTQEQLNAAYKMPEFDFATKYAGYAKTILSACFFAPLSPLVMVVATVGIVIEYALDKYVMLRHRARGRSIGTELPFEFVEFLEYCMVLFALGNFLANVSVTNFDPSDELLTMMGLAIGLLNAILPMGKINERLFPAKDEALTQDTYSAVHPELPEDYNTSNPATADAAAKMCRIGDVHGHP